MNRLRVMWDAWRLYGKRGEMLRKLTSRKLWAAVAAAALGTLGMQLGVADVELVKWGIGALIAYILGESAVDAAGALLKPGK